MSVTSCRQGSAESRVPDIQATARAVLTEGLTQLADPAAPRQRQAIILLVWLVARLTGTHDLAAASRLWTAMQENGTAVFQGLRLRFDPAGPGSPISVET
ncbi:hypothetical protein KH5H1_60950 [Corallococcus caeni]|uniref:hypothetical protein n=1 Tax=Corallococcus caeni TaxID=3082388 RepID=UPI0029580B00|nr:hypothetical protein KH5H1_60950 [Corallococcus sp. KH5-1]